MHFQYTSPTCTRAPASKNSSGTSSWMGAGSPSPIHTKTSPLSVCVGYILASEPGLPQTPESGPSDSTATFLPLSS